MLGTLGLPDIPDAYGVVLIVVQLGVLLGLILVGRDS